MAVVNISIVCHYQLYLMDTVDIQQRTWFTISERKKSQLLQNHNRALNRTNCQKVTVPVLNTSRKQRFIDFLSEYLTKSELPCIHALTLFGYPDRYDKLRCRNQQMENLFVHKKLMFMAYKQNITSDIEWFPHRVR